MPRNQSLLKKVPYDAIADFEPISKLGTITLALVGHPSVPANDVKSLIAYAKANPGKLSFGSGSTSSRIAGELLKTLAGIDMLHVPYKSNPQVVTDLLGGQISLFFGDVSTSLPPVRAGKLKGFAVSSLTRSSLAPDLPTLDEAGIPGYDLTAWFAAFVPAKTPKPIVDKLNAALREALADKEVSAKLLAAGIEPAASSPDELKAFVMSETSEVGEDRRRRENRAGVRSSLGRGGRIRERRHHLAREQLDRTQRFRERHVAEREPRQQVVGAARRDLGGEEIAHGVWRAGNRSFRWPPARRRSADKAR